MSTLLKITVTPQGNMTQKEAERYLGGSAPLKVLEEKWGLVPWDKNPTRKQYRTGAIEEAMIRAERSVQQLTAKS